MSPELGIGKARGEVTEQHHRRKERHDPWIADAEGGDPAAVGHGRPDEIGQLGPVEPGRLGVRLVLLASRSRKRLTSSGRWSSGM